MEPLCAFAGKVLELTVEPIGRQLGYLIFYYRNVNRLKVEFHELQNERKAMQHLVDAARSNGEKIEENVQDWFTKVDDITERAKKLYEEESHVKTRCLYKSCPNLWLRHRLGREAKNMTQEVAEIKRKGKFNKVSFNEPPQRYLSSTGIKGIESRVSTMNNVLKALGDSNVNMIGLYGLPGVGKTTLANEVVKRVKKEKLFEMVAIVTVAQHPDLKEIQRQIAENVGMKLDVETESVRASRLRERLKQEKKLLVVLDDLWERLDLDRVGIPFDFDGNKKNLVDGESDKHYTKILLTSRNKDLLSNQMRCERIIMVCILSEKEAWELFKEKAELHDNSNDLDLLAVEHEVAKQCCQLPLAIVAVAWALRGKSPSEWRDALQRLKKPLRRNIAEFSEVDSSLRLSYDYLNNHDIQSIFLLSAMLSHDPLMIDLLMYSMGLSLLQDIDSIEEARDRLDTFVNKLKSSNLLLDSFSNDHFTMHDLVRNLALSIASEEQHALVVRSRKQYKLPEKNLLEGYTRLCLDKCDITEFPEELYCPMLEFFLLDNKNTDLRIPSMFFKSMQGLKVMNFTNMHFSSLPSSLYLLENIKTLCLHSCTLEDIAEVGKLKNLNVLSLAYSIIKRLPSELGRLTCLQMLNLAHCSKLEVIPPKLLSSLKRLEVLNMENSFNKWEAEGSGKGNDNASLMELMHLPNLSSLDIHIPDVSILPKDFFLEKSLKRYRIFIGQDWEWSGQYETSKTLKLKLESSIHLEHGVRKLLERAEDLYLDELYEIDNVIYGLDGRGFQHLKYLWIQNNSQIEYIVNSTGHVDAFPNLETLDLSNLNGLKKLCRGHITARSFQKLRVIKVSRCNRLEVLFLTSMVALFGSLVEIHISQCQSIQEIVVSTDKNTFQQNFATGVIIFHQLHSLKMAELPTLTNFFFNENATNNGDNDIFKSFFSNKVAFPKLEILEMSSVKNIQYIWSNQLLHNSFINLKTLVVRRCGILVKLIPLHILKCLTNLEELEVRECSLLEMVFDLEDLKSADKEIHSLLAVPLKELELWNLQKLKHVWSNDPKGIVSFQSLRHVQVSECESLTSVFPASIAKSLLDLEELKIMGSGMEVIVAKDEVLESVATFEFPKLTSLDLYDLDKLKNFYPHTHLLECPCLRSLTIVDCGELEIFEKEISSSSRLQEEKEHHTKYPLFFQEKQIPNLEELTLMGKYAMMIWNGQLPAYHFRNVRFLKLSKLTDDAANFPYGLLNRFPNLEELRVEASSIQEIFSCTEALGDDAGQIAPFRKLSLVLMENLKHIWNEHSQMDRFLQNLQSLRVEWCSDLINLGPSSVSLKNLTDLQVIGCDGLLNLLTSSTARSLEQLTRLEISWCSKIEEIISKEGEDVEKEIVFRKLEHLKLYSLPALINLGPSSVSLKNLTYLKVNECHGLLNLLTSSTARSLEQLTRLEISYCDQIEEIITKEGEDVEKEIVFRKLEHLILFKLPCLKSFCSHNYTVKFPLLNKVYIYYCPNLQGIEMIRNEKRWEVNLNKTIILL